MKHWQDRTNAIIAGWLIISPFVLGFQGEFSALANAVLVGVLLLATALGAILVPRAWEEWTETALGLWLAVSPWIVGFGHSAARVNAVVAGLVILTLALWSLQDDGQAASNEKTAH